MANQPRADNPARTFRCEDELWDESMEAAAFEGDKISEVLRESLRRYVKRVNKKREAAADAALSQ